MPNVKPFRGSPLNFTHPLTRGLVACWLMNEGTGNQVFDYTRNGNKGTILGADWVPGRDGAALSFNGNGNEVQIPDNSLLDLGDKFTISLGIKPNGAGEGGYLISKTTVADGWGLYWQGTADRLLYVPGNIPSDTVFTEDNMWVKPLMTFDSGAVSFYKNGIAAGTGVGATNISNNDDIFIANRTSGVTTGTYFGGLVCWVMIWNRVLSAADIRYHQFNPYAMLKLDISPGILGSPVVTPSIAAISHSIGMNHIQEYGLGAN